MTDFSDIGMSIDGLGTDEIPGNAGTIWGWSGNPPPNTPYSWVNGLVEPIDPGMYRAEPENAELSIAGFTAKLAMQPRITRVILNQGASPAYTLQSDISASQTSIQLDAAGASGVLYLNAETMLIVSDDGGGAYTVERGFWGSNAEDHGQGVGAYTDPPFLRNRIVRLWVHTGASAVQVGRGYIREPEPDDGHVALRLRVEGPLVGIQNAKRMQFNPDLREIGEFRITSETDGEQGATSKLTLSEFPFGSVVAKLRDANGNSRDSWYYGGNDLYQPETIAWGQVNGAIFPLAEVVKSGMFWDGVWEPTVGAGCAKPNPFPDNEFGETDVGIVDEPMYELAVWNRRLPKAPYPLADAESVVDNPWQPVFIAGVLLCSGDHPQIRPQKLDFVSGNVGLGAGFLLGDEGIQDFIDLANEDSHLSIDQLYLGWDGESVNVFDVVLQILAAYGYWLGTTADGYVTVNRDDIGTVEDLGEAQENPVEPIYDRGEPPKIRQRPGFSRAIRRYVATVGETPWGDGKKAEGRAVGASAQVDTMIEPETNELDFSTIHPSRTDFVADMILRKARKGQAQKPTVTIRANDWRLLNIAYDQGQYVTLTLPQESDALLYDEDGEFVPPDSAKLQESDFMMQITGRGHNAEVGSYELEASLNNFALAVSRFIGPACVVGAANVGSGEIEVEADLSAPYGRPEDLDYFEVGQQVQVHNSKLAPTSANVFEIVDIDIGAQTIILEGETGKVTVETGDVIRTARYDAYTFADYGSTIRGWIYFADAQDTLGSNDDPADRWD